MSNKESLKVGIVIGEHSGDRLGSKIIQSLSKEYNISIVGVGGPLTEALGLKSIFNFKHLHVMGLIEPLLNIRKLLKHQKKLIKIFKDEKIDFFIGVDSPDFNLPIHKALKKTQNTKTIQLVSPSVWGWRQGRIKNIKKYIDLTLCLFKFEHEFYQSYGARSFLVGHPLSEIFIPYKEDIQKKYLLPDNKIYIAVLPGSRNSEITNMMPTYVKTMKRLNKKNKNFHFLIPAADDVLKKKIESYIPSEISITIGVGNARDFLALSDFSIVTSGTASLEAAILGSAPIICYKTNNFNYFIISRMLKTKLVGLPNLLLSREAFPELIQDKCNEENISIALDSLMKSSDLKSVFDELHSHLYGNGFDEAAKEILDLN